jgi:hypothetical protein
MAAKEIFKREAEKYRRNIESEKSRSAFRVLNFIGDSLKTEFQRVENLFSKSDNNAENTEEPIQND